MFTDKKGPIEEFTWGTFIINGQTHKKNGGEKSGQGKDIRLIGDEVSKWKERKGHTLSHDMITGIYEHDIDTLIIGAGVNHAIDCPGEVIRKIKENGIPEVKVAKTPEACKLYNELYHKGKKVALLAHGTC